MSKLEQIKAFAVSSFAVAAHTVRMGFELETQEFEGDCFETLKETKTYKPKLTAGTRIDIKNEIECEFRCIFDNNASYRRLISRSLEIDPNKRGPQSNAHVERLLSELKIEINVDDDENLPQLLMNTVHELGNDQRKLAAEILTEFAMLNDEIVDLFNSEKEYTQLSGAMQSVIATGLTYERDGSVNGPEIQTVGPNKFRQCLNHSKFLFKNFEFEINEECSFHVHLSIPGIKHSYGRNLQIALMLSVILAPNRPGYIHNRWQHTVENDEDDGESWLEKYFSVSPSTNKNTFVAFRGDTWEFRCFGNVTDVEDAEWCLKTAVKSMQRGYCLLHNIEELPGYAELCRLGNHEIDIILTRLADNQNADASFLLDIMNVRGHMGIVAGNRELEAA